jgi:uncharacterized protein YqcC (DUF446 family)
MQTMRFRLRLTWFLKKSCECHRFPSKASTKQPEAAFSGQMPVWTLEMTPTLCKMTKKPFPMQAMRFRPWLAWFSKRSRECYRFPSKASTKQPETASKWAAVGLDSWNDRNLVKDDNKNQVLTQTMRFRPWLAWVRRNHVSVINFRQKPLPKQLKVVVEVEQASENKSMFII